MKKHLATLALAAGTPAVSAQGNLVFNGGFEQGAFVESSDFAGRMRLSGTAGDLPGWSVSIGSGPLAYVWRMQTPNIAKEGGHMLSLDSNTARPGSSIAQALGTVPGQDYVLAFWYSSDRNDGPSLMEIYLGDRLLGSVSHKTGTIAGNVFDYLDWSYASYTFTADSASTSLKFLDATDGAYNTVLDGISVVAVPEPGSLTLLAAGALAVGLARCVRRR